MEVDPKGRPLLFCCRRPNRRRRVAIFSDFNTLPTNLFGLVRPRSATLRPGRIAGSELCFISVICTLPTNCFGLVRPRSAMLRSGRIALTNWLVMQGNA
jgi:deoxycytidine triphosphate deaminase